MFRCCSDVFIVVIKIYLGVVKELYSRNTNMFRCCSDVFIVVIKICLGVVQMFVF